MVMAVTTVDLVRPPIDRPVQAAARAELANDPRGGGGGATACRTVRCHRGDAAAGHRSRLMLTVVGGEVPVQAGGDQEAIRARVAVHRGTGASVDARGGVGAGVGAGVDDGIATTIDGTVTAVVAVAVDMAPAMTAAPDTEVDGENPVWSCSVS